MTDTRKRWLWVLAAVVVLLMAVLTFQSGERGRAQDRERLDPSTVAQIEASTDCGWLQQQFATADHNQSIDAGRAATYMALIDERMRTVGCYP
jgi:hypothetical protein